MDRYSSALMQLKEAVRQASEREVAAIREFNAASAVEGSEENKAFLAVRVERARQLKHAAFEELIAARLAL